MPRTYARSPTHGTRSMYANWRCRCDLCTQANRTYQREYSRQPKQRACSQQNSRDRHYRLKLTRETHEKNVETTVGVDVEAAPGAV